MSDFWIFAIIALAMIIIALVFIIAPPILERLRDKQNGGGNYYNKTRPDWRFACAAAVFVVALAPGLYWFSGTPQSFAPQTLSDADAVVAILLSAAERAQANGDDANATKLRRQAQEILNSSGEQQRAIIRRLLAKAKAAADENKPDSRNTP